MTDPHHDTEAPFERARAAFEALDLEAQARFLVQGTAKTLLRGAARFSENLADEMEEAFRPKERPAAASEEPHEDEEQRREGDGGAAPHDSRPGAQPPPTEPDAA